MLRATCYVLRGYGLRPHVTCRGGRVPKEAGFPDQAAVFRIPLGYQRTFASNWTVSTDYMHTRGNDEGRVQVIKARCT